MSTAQSVGLFSVAGASLTERVYRRLAAEIAEGRLPPGQQLLETALGRRLGVSRTPVREALRLLVNEGLATATPGGVEVTQLTVKDVRDLLRTEEVLDGLACRLAAENGTEGDFSRLEEIFARLEAAAGRSDPAGWVEADTELHAHIAQMAGNQVLTRFSEQVNTLLGRMRQMSARLPGRMQQMIAENRRVVDAIERRDGAEAERAVKDHVRTVEQVVVGILEDFVVPFRGDRF